MRRGRWLPAGQDDAGDRVGREHRRQVEADAGAVGWLTDGRLILTMIAVQQQHVQAVMEDRLQERYLRLDAQAGGSLIVMDAPPAQENCQPFVHVAGLLREAGLTGRPVSSVQIGFVLAPRINAAGRMGRAELAAELLLTQDPAKAERLARELCDLNRERQSVEQDARLKQLVLTEKGRQFHEDTMRAFHQTDEYVAGLLTEEENTELLRLLNKLRKALQ